MTGTPPRTLILHADDLGLNRAVTDGILRGCTQGALTSASVLANGPDFERACEQWKSLPSNPSPHDLGVHLNLTQGRPLTGRRYPRELLDAAGRFPGIGRLFLRLTSAARRHRDALRAELAAQTERVLRTGIQVTHLNGHQYAELIPPVADTVLSLAQEYQIPVLRCARELGMTQTLPWTSFGGRFLAGVKRLYAERFARKLAQTSLCAPQLYFGASHAGRIDAPLLRKFLDIALTADAQSVEIALHPGAAPAETSATEIEAGWHDPLAVERGAELELLTGAELPVLIRERGFSLGRLAELVPQRSALAAA